MDVITEYAMEKIYGNLDFEDFNKDMANYVQGLGLVWRLGKHVKGFSLSFA